MASKHLYTLDAEGSFTQVVDNGALRKEETAVLALDSNKLGGKAPEYYLQSVNLLDNSNFQINQRGQASYTGSGIYTVDRWKIAIRNGTLNVLDNGISFTNNDTSGPSYIEQRVAIERFKIGATYTMAACINDNILCGTFVYNGETSGSTTADSAKLRIYFYEQFICFRFSFPVATTDSIVNWVALYEGEYTTKTLPPYVPKGYVTELAECRRYYRKFSGLTLSPYNINSSIRYYRLMLDPPMRTNVNPTISNIAGGEQLLNSWTDTNAIIDITRTLPTDITLSATGDNSASNFVLLVDISISSDL